MCVSVCFNLGSTFVSSKLQKKRFLEKPKSQLSDPLQIKVTAIYTRYQFFMISLICTFFVGLKFTSHFRISETNRLSLDA